MSSDMILAREAQLIYSNLEGWNPVGNSLRTWRGEIEVGQFNKKNYVFEVFLPNLFPSVPPVVRAVSSMQHPNVDSDGFISLKILENWRAEFHVYQVITSLTGLMTRAPPTSKEVDSIREAKIAKQEASSVSKPDKKDNLRVTLLEREIESLKGKLREKDERLTKIRARDAIEQPSHTATSSATRSSVRTSESSGKVTEVDEDLIVQLESEKVATSELLAKLHDDYSTGDINIYDYSRLYKKYSRELYLLQEKIAYVKRKLEE